MVKFNNFGSSLLLFLMMYCINIFPQTRISAGIISSGGGSQSNSLFKISGTIGTVSAEKSSNSLYQTNPGFWNTFSRIDYPSAFAMNADFSFGDVTQTSNYQIIGIPGINNVSIADLITGSEGKTGNWRAFADTGAGNYLEFDGSGKFMLRPGNAFWLISKSPVVINKTVNTVPLSNDYSFKIPLHPGWNLISDPFDKIISWQNIKIINGITQPIYNYRNGLYISDSDNFAPYKGYYFYNSTGIDSLKIPYSPASASLPKLNSASIKNMTISLVSGKTIMTKIEVGFSAKANSGLDSYDIFSPPSQFCSLNIALFNKNLGTGYKYLQTEFRQTIGEGQEYNIVVKNTTSNTVLLAETGLENYDNYEIYLFDKNSLKFYNLKKNDKIEITPSLSEKQYSLFIGTESYIAGKEKNYLPTSYQLFQNYPNPFNPTTRIRFALPAAGRISLRIYNILGQLIASPIKDENYDEGYHEIVFSGNALSSGVYFYRLTAGNYTDTKKMLLIK